MNKNRNILGDTEKCLKRTLKGNDRTTLTFLMMGFMGVASNRYNVAVGAGYQFGKRDIEPNELDKLKAKLALVNTEKSNLEERVSILEEKLDQVLKLQQK